jgi:hypothetical protein
MAIVRPEGPSHWKISKLSPGIQSATVHFVAQCLNQQRYGVHNVHAIPYGPFFGFVTTQPFVSSTEMTTFRSAML